MERGVPSSVPWQLTTSKQTCPGGALMARGSLPPQYVSQAEASALQQQQYYQWYQQYNYAYPYSYYYPVVSAHPARQGQAVEGRRWDQSGRVRGSGWIDHSSDSCWKTLPELMVHKVNAQVLRWPPTLPSLCPRCHRDSSPSAHTESTPASALSSRADTRCALA